MDQEADGNEINVLVYGNHSFVVVTSKCILCIITNDEQWKKSNENTQRRQMVIVFVLNLGLK